MERCNFAASLTLKKMNEKDYGTLPIRRLFIKCTVPSMVGMGFAAVYSVVDGIFVGRYIGGEALAAVNLVMPLVMIAAALADMVATGSSVRISILLGGGKVRKASRVFSYCLGVITALSSAFGLLGFVFAKPLITLMGADGATATFAVDYLRIFALFMPLCSIYFSTDNYLRVCGKVKLSMTINIVCSLLNIAADYVLIVLMNQGLWAAAMASCISMTVGAVWSLMPFLRKKLPLKFVRGRLTFRQLMPIAANGSSEFFVSIAGSLFAVIVNVVLLRLGGSTAVAAVSVVEYIGSLTGMVLHVITEALQPAVSYCFGAGLTARYKKIQKAIMLSSAVFSVLAMVFLLTGGRFLLPFFVMDGDNDLYTMAWRAVQFYALSYLVGWIDGTLSSYMTALEKPWHSLSISLLSTFVFPIIMLAVLVPFWGLDGVWILNFAAGILSASAAVIIVKKALKNIENVDLKLVTK